MGQLESLDEELPSKVGGARMRILGLGGWLSARHP